MPDKKWLRALLISLSALLLLVSPSNCGRPQSPKNRKAPRQELSEKRTPNSKVYRNPDGTYTSVIYAAPVQFKDGSGRWRDVDTGIEDFEFRGASYWARFGQAPSFRFSIQDVWVKFVPQLADEARGIATEREITYPDVFKSTDIKYSAGPSELKEEIILKDPSAPSVFIFEVESNKGIPPLKDGSLDFGYFKTLPPFATDAEGQKKTVKVSMKRIDSSDHLFLTLDQNWRTRAIYPIVIDPSIIIQPDPAVGRDTYIDQKSHDQNFGTEAVLDVHSGSYNTRSLIQFDLSPILKGSTMRSAVMSLYVRTAFGGNVFARRVTSEWDENLVTWDNQPSFEEIVAGQVVDAGNMWMNWEVTELVKDWHGGKSVNRGVILLTEEDPAVTTGAEFYSSDYTGDINLRPKLEVTYTIEAEAPTSSITSPTNGAFIAGTNYAITGTAEDNLRGTGIARVEVSTDGGNNWHEATGTISWSFEWILPGDGKYKVMSRAVDLSGNVEQPGSGVQVVVDNSPPESIIAYPVAEQGVSGTLEIKGTAKDENFAMYKVMYGPGNLPTSWTQIGQIHEFQVDNDILERISTRSLNGTYTFRLQVEDKAKNTAVYSTTVTLENY